MGTIQGRDASRSCTPVLAAAALGAATLCFTLVVAASVSHRQGAEGRSPQPARQLQEVCNDNIRWSQNLWQFLSWQEQQAWTVLGWTQATWDAAHPKVQRRRLDSSVLASVAGSTEAGVGQAKGLRRLQAPTPPGPPTTTTTTYVPPSESACYQSLAEPQKDAVRTLGYTIGGWHACKNAACPWPADIPRPDASCLEHMVHLESKYNTSTVRWSSLSASRREAFVILGWDQDGFMWSASEKPTAYASKWSALKVTFPRKAEAAEFLGYQSRVWDGCVQETPCLVRLRRLEAKMNSWRWGIMPSGIQQRLVELGWAERTWIEGEPPASYANSWSNLPHNVAVPARLLGYNHDTWELCPSSACLERFAYIQDRFNMPWSALKLSQQRAWMLLGHSPELWAKHGMVGTTALQSRWDELSPEQRQQASFLSFDRESWQGCNSNWVAPVSNNSISVLPGASLRQVRARMVIKRPFAEISGNVFGNKVAQMPTSFILLFRRSVARSLFCGNPPLSNDAKTYIDASGGPLCKDAKTFEMQRGRVVVNTVTEGSIIVDFSIGANRSATQDTATALFEALQRQLSRNNSALVQDAEFGRFARVATVQQVPLSHLPAAEQAAALQFEKTRGAYTSATACQLHEDVRNGITRCATVGVANGRQFGMAAAAGLFAAAASWV